MNKRDRETIKKTKKKTITKMKMKKQKKTLSTKMIDYFTLFTHLLYLYTNIYYIDIYE